MTFVKDFVEDNMQKLSSAINDYAKEKQVEIVQISYSYAAGMEYHSRALVLFKKRNKNRKIKTW